MKYYADTLHPVCVDTYTLPRMKRIIDFRDGRTLAQRCIRFLRAEPPPAPPQDPASQLLRLTHHHASEVDAARNKSTHHPPQVALAGSRVAGSTTGRFERQRMLDPVLTLVTTHGFEPTGGHTITVNGVLAPGCDGDGSGTFGSEILENEANQSFLHRLGVCALASAVMHSMPSETRANATLVMPERTAMEPGVFYPLLDSATNVRLVGDGHELAVPLWSMTGQRFWPSPRR